MIPKKKNSTPLLILCFLRGRRFMHSRQVFFDFERQFWLIFFLSWSVIRLQKQNRKDTKSQCKQPRDMAKESPEKIKKAMAMEISPEKRILDAIWNAIWNHLYASTMQTHFECTTVWLRNKYTQKYATTCRRPAQQASTHAYSESVFGFLQLFQSAPLPTLVQLAPHRDYKIEFCTLLKHKTRN